MMPNRSTQRAADGFTLIELLIVVAIIAILAAIAVPNFLEAQTRSKVSRTKADLRSLATALEAYRVDQNKYPYPTQRDLSFPLNFPRSTEYARFAAGTMPLPYGVFSEELSTPVAYTTTIFRDVFKEAGFGVTPGSVVNKPGSSPWYRFGFGTAESGASNVANIFDVNSAFYSNSNLQKRPDLNNKKWLATSLGPDRAEDVYSAFTMAEYDPTNGTISPGDISRSGP